MPTVLTIPEETAPMTDDEATEFEWFLLEVMARTLFGDQHEIIKANKLKTA